MFITFFFLMKQPRSNHVLYRLSYVSYGHSKALIYATQSGQPPVAALTYVRAATGGCPTEETSVAPIQHHTPALLLCTQSTCCTHPLHSDLVVENITGTTCAPELQLLHRQSSYGKHSSMLHHTE